jgi:predicted nucleic acid-binding protein
MSSINHTVVITDASCLIILDKLFLLEVLPQLFTTILTTPEIAEEYGKTLPYWLNVTPVTDQKSKNHFAEMVDSGEASAIALAIELNNAALITDDLQARKLSIKLGLSVIGSLGILLKAKNAGYITLLKPYLEQMKLTNFRVSDDLYQAVLKKAGEND